MKPPLKRKKKRSRRELVREAWTRGNLKYKFHQGQKDLYSAFEAKSKGQIFVNECGRQFGKTFFWVAVAIMFAIQNPKAKIKLGTAFQTDLIEFIFPAFDAVTQDCPQDLMPKYLGYRSKYIFPNGSEIKLVGLDKRPNGMRGNVIDLIIIDEAGFTDKLLYLYRSVIIPATTHRPNCRVVMSSSTPREEDHPFFEFVEKAEFEGAYIRKTIDDNPMVDEATRERLIYEMGGSEGRESVEVKRELYCVRIRDPESVIIGDWDDKYVQDIPRDHYYGFYHKYDAMDLGVVRDKTVVLFGYYEYMKGRLVIEDEYDINGPKLTTLVLKDAIEKKEKDLWGIQTPYKRISDNNNPLLIQDLSLLHGLYFSMTDKGTIEEMVNTLKIMVRSGQVIVNPRCKQLWGCLKYGVWDKKRDKFANHKIFGHYDALAALIYLCRNLDKVTNPIPYDYMADRNNQIVFIRNDLSQTAQVFKNALGLKGK